MKIFWKIVITLILISFYSCSKGQIDTNSVSRVELSKQNIPEFEVDFPKTKFNVKRTENRAPYLGNVVITNWILQGANDNGPFMYFVAHNKISEQMKTQIQNGSKSLDVAFQAMLTSSAKKLGGENFKFNKISYNQYKGLESICEVFNGQGIIKSRVYKIEDNFFMVSAGGKNIDKNSVEKFLDSFRLKDIENN